MRYELALYFFAIIFFILAAIAAIILVETERILLILATVVLGLIFAGLGYYYRKAIDKKQKTLEQTSQQISDDTNNASNEGQDKA